MKTIWILFSFFFLFICLSFSQDVKHDSGKNFKDAMKTLGGQGNSRVTNDRKVAKIKQLEEVIVTRERKKVQEDYNTDSPLDDKKFGDHMAELTKRLTGDSLPDFEAPPPTAEEESYDETEEERIKRHRRQASYARLLEELNENGGSNSPLASEILTRISGNPDLNEKLQDTSGLYKRNLRPKFVPTTLKEETTQESTNQQQTQIVKEGDSSDSSTASKYKLKQKKKSVFQEANDSLKNSKEVVSSNIDINHNSIMEFVQIVEIFFKTPQGNFTAVALAYLIIVTLIRLLRLYWIIYLARAFVNCGLFGIVGGILAYSIIKEPQSYSHSTIKDFASLMIENVTSVYSLLILLNVLAISSFSFINLLSLLLSCAVGYHFTRLPPTLSLISIAPLYASGLALMSLLSILQIFFTTQPQKSSEEDSDVDISKLKYETKEVISKQEDNETSKEEENENDLDTHSHSHTNTANKTAKKTAKKRTQKRKE